MSRSDLKDLGEHLDSGETGLIVVAAADVGSRIEAALERANTVTRKELQASDVEIDKDLVEAGNESSG